MAPPAEETEKPAGQARIGAAIPAALPAFALSGATTISNAESLIAGLFNSKGATKTVDLSAAGRVQPDSDAEDSSDDEECS